jgi:hypothetical protein
MAMNIHIIQVYSSTAAYQQRDHVLLVLDVAAREALNNTHLNPVLGVLFITTRE